jgi:hypothetical protein
MMPRTLKVAAIQMDAAPTPTTERLARAATLINQAAEQDAKLIALPELFNTGYEYSAANYARAEPMDGETVRWMREQAVQHGVHLAGTLLLLDEEEIYNAALLVAPNGRMWRYDKNHPFLWERAYFREGERITIADTDLGKLGLMICFDYLVPSMWKRYAGKVDAMVMMSCPPRVHTIDLVFPDGTRVNTRELGPAFSDMYPSGEHPFGEDLNQQVGWMRVPLVNTVGSGAFRSKMPQANVSLGAYLMARPDLWERLAQADDVVIEAGYDLETKVVDASGKVVTRVEQPGDGFVVATITMADEMPQPLFVQPRLYLSPIARLFSDMVGPALMVMEYRRGIRRQWGARMAPIDPRTKTWTGAVMLSALGGWLVGRMTSRKS